MGFVGMVTVVIVLVVIGIQSQLLGIHGPRAEGHAHALELFPLQVALDAFFVAPEAALKGGQVHAEHVEGGNASGQPTHSPQHGADLKGRPQNLVLGPEPGKGRDAADGQGADQKGNGRNRHVLAQTAHQPHVLSQGGVVTHDLFHAVDDGTGTQEQHRLKVGVGHQVEQTGPVSTSPHGHNHVAQLGHGGVGQAFFDVVLGDGNGGPHEGGERTGIGHHGHYRRNVLKHRIHPRHQEYPGGHHGGRVNQGGNGGGAFHGVGQPHMQGELGRLGHGTEEHQHSKYRRQAAAQGTGVDQAGQPLAHDVEIKTAGGPEDGQHPQQQAEVAHAVGDKSFLAGIGGGFAVVPEANQQVGTHPHQLPKDVNLQQVGANHQAQHG